MAVTTPVAESIAAPDAVDPTPSAHVRAPPPAPPVAVAVYGVPYVVDAADVIETAGWLILVTVKLPAYVTV